MARSCCRRPSRPSSRRSCTSPWRARLHHGIDPYERSLARALALPRVGERAVPTASTVKLAGGRLRHGDVRGARSDLGHEVGRRTRATSVDRGSTERRRDELHRRVARSDGERGQRLASGLTERARRDQTDARRARRPTGNSALDSLACRRNPPQPPLRRLYATRDGDPLSACGAARPSPLRGARPRTRTGRAATIHTLERLPVLWESLIASRTHAVHVFDRRRRARGRRDA